MRVVVVASPVAVALRWLEIGSCVIGVMFDHLEQPRGQIPSVHRQIPRARSGFPVRVELLRDSKKDGLDHVDFGRDVEISFDGVTQVGRRQQRTAAGLRGIVVESEPEVGRARTESAGALEAFRADRCDDLKSAPAAFLICEAVT